MVKDNTTPSWTVRNIAVFAMVLVVAEGAWLLNKAYGETRPPIAVATTCGELEADADKLFGKSDTATLRGTFAPGDHVQMEIDFSGVGYSWEVTGVLAKSKATNMNGSGVFYTYVKNKISRDEAVITKSTVVDGTLNGFAILKLDVVVARAGEGAITINKGRSLPLLTPPRLSRVSCEATKKVHWIQRSSVSGT